MEETGVVVAGVVAVLLAIGAFTAGADIRAKPNLLLCRP